MKSPHLLRHLLALLCFAAAALAAGAGRADEKPTLRIVPDQIALQPGLLSQEIVVLFAPGDKATVREARLQLLDSPGLKTTLKSQPTLPADSDLEWRITIAAGPQAPKESVLVLVLTYRLDPVAGVAGPARSTIATATAKVSYSALTLQQSIRVTAVNGFDTLVVGKERQAVLQVENSGPDDIWLEKVDKQSPQHLTVKAAGLPYRIPARTTVPVPIDIGTTERIVPGTAPLLLALGFSRPSDGDRATVGVSTPVQAAIPGLSEIKTALQVPTLLFLPGMLVVLTWALLWPLAYPAPDRDKEFALKVATPGFWIVAVSLSLVIAWLYSHFGTNDEAGLLESVSLRDVALIWFGSIFAISPALYFAGAGVMQGVRELQRREEVKRQAEAARQEAERQAEAARREAERQAEAARQERERNPQTSDGPLEILAKLGRQVSGATLRLPAYNVTDGASPQRLFALGFGATADAQHAWVVPTIRLEPALEHRDAVDEIIVSGDLGRLLAFLDEHEEGCRIDWDRSGRVKAPDQIDKIRLATSVGRSSIVERI